MSNITTQFSHEILNFLLGRSSYTSKPTYYIGLSKQPLGNEGSGLSEPAGGNYARLAIPNNKTSFSAAANKSVKLIKEFRYAETPADISGEWGTVTHFIISDSPTGGNILLYGALKHARTVERQSHELLEELRRRQIAEPEETGDIIELDELYTLVRKK